MNVTNLGPLVLAGSGEYTPMMEIVDRFLLEQSDRTRTVLLIATSCAQEGDDVMTRWEQMGVAHFRGLGVEATPVRIRNSAEADLPENAGQIEEAGFVWFSGGSPAYLAQSFHNTRSWQALEAANRRGAVVAGASGGLGVLNDHVPSVNPPAADAAPYTGPTALGLAAPLRALAHFDRMEARRPEFVDRVVSVLQAGQVAIGVDEDTALVWTQGEWRAMGHKRVVVFDGRGGRTIFKPGDRVDNLPAPNRAQAPASK